MVNFPAITTMTNTWSQTMIFPAITTMTNTWSQTVILPVITTATKLGLKQQDDLPTIINSAKIIA